MSYYIYILECSNNTYYTGYTTDIQRRYQEHCNGSKKCKYTRSFPPKRIAVCWQCHLDKSTILSIEKTIQHLSKKEKAYLSNHPEDLPNHLSELGMSDYGANAIHHYKIKSES